MTNGIGNALYTAASTVAQYASCAKETYAAKQDVDFGFGRTVSFSAYAKKSILAGVITSNARYAKKIARDYPNSYKITNFMRVAGNLTQHIASHYFTSKSHEAHSINGIYRNAVQQSLDPSVNTKPLQNRFGKTTVKTDS